MKSHSHMVLKLSTPKVNQNSEAIARNSKPWYYTRSYSSSRQQLQWVLSCHCSL